MLLITKTGCPKCTYIKKHCDLTGVTLLDITVMDKEKLAELAWNGCVELSQTQLPILVTDTFERVTGAINIKRVLEGEK